MVGLFPLDLRSELKQRCVGGGIAGFALKKSSTNIDIGIKKSDPIPIAAVAPCNPSDLLKSIKQRELKSKLQKDDSDDEDGVENLSFKEKLQLIERSSSRNLVNPL